MADTSTTITRKADVATVLQAGGYIAVPSKRATGPKLVALFNAAGKELPAWQTAIRANLPQCDEDGALTHQRATIYRWRVSP